MTERFASNHFHRVLLAVLALAIVSSGCFGLSKKEEEAVSLHVRNGVRYYEHGRFLQAEQQGRKALNVDPTNKEAKLLVAMALVQQGGVSKLRSATDRLQQLAKRSPRDYRVHLSLGLAEFRLAEIAMDRIDQLESAGTDAPDPEATERLQRTRTEKEDLLSRAKQRFQRVLKLNSENPDALASLGQIAALEHRSEEALGYLHRYLVLAEQTRRYRENEKKDRILTDDQGVRLQEKIERNIQKEIRYRDLVANIYYDRGEPTKSIEQLNRILALRPSWADAYLQRAHCWAKIDSGENVVADVKVFLRKTDRAFEDPWVKRANGMLQDYGGK